MNTAQTGRRTAGWNVLIVVASTGWLLATLADYSSTPLGRIPLVDSLQQIELSRLIAIDAIPAVPFHRSPLYAWTLSWAWRLGADEAGVFLLARGLNALAVILAASAAWRLSVIYGGSRRAGAIAYALVAANPVVAFYAGDAFDISVAMALGAWGAVWVVEASLRGSYGGSLGWAAAGAFALAAQFRSHFLPLAVAWALWSAWVARPRLLAQCAAFGPLALSLLGFAWANYAVSGEFRALPWQGAYNLWAGNGPAANGRYYAQIVETGEIPAHDNPARVESVLLYERATARRPPYTVAEMNRYWIFETARSVIADPIRWFKLMGLKLQALLNDHEQYDNKTYSYHAALSPWLRWNPFGWGLLFILAVGGWSLVAKERRPTARILIGLSLVYMAGVLLFYPTSRFRLPLFPWMAAFAALSLCAHPLRAWRWRTFVITGLAAIAAFNNSWGVNRDPAIAQDCRMLAYASFRCGESAQALAWSVRGLEEAPRDTGLWRLQAVSCLHMAADGVEPMLPRLGDWVGPDSEPEGRVLLRGIIACKAGDREGAVRIWLSLVHAQNRPLSDEARALVLWAGWETALAVQRREKYDVESTWLQVAKAERGDQEASVQVRYLSHEEYEGMRKGLDWATRGQH